MGFLSRTLAGLCTAFLAAPVTLILVFASAAQSQAPASPSEQKPAATTQPPAEPAAEVATRETPTTFKVRVNVVLVRVVARDARGRAIGTLRKEDFRLFDKGKPQVISSFAVEKPGSHTEASRAAAVTARSEAPANEVLAKDAPALPERFAAILFDDLNLSLENAMESRVAAAEFLAALQPTDRVAILTTSGRGEAEFTEDRAQLKEALQRIMPHPLSGGFGRTCPDVSYYEADLIVNQHDERALNATAQETLQCAFANDTRYWETAVNMTQVAAQNALNVGEASTEATFRRIQEVVRRMTVLPGQRTIVLVSPGFYMTFATRRSTDVIDRATSANVVVNTIDARGLYAPVPGGDIADQGVVASAFASGVRDLNRIANQTAQSEVLGELADGTGGSFFHNRNDLGEGMRQVAAAPEFSYVLGFSPQNLKLDGSYHTLKVTLATKEKFSLQARRGYFAPQGSVDPAEAAKKEIEEAVFSQEELHDLPVELQTQFFKRNEENASLAVLMRVDLKGLRYRRAEGRNQNNLTIAAAIFDQNGNFVTGGEKLVEMKLRDTTLERLGHSGITVKSSFDVKPGTYMVRLVVRDSEAEQMAARNSAVKIPF